MIALLALALIRWTIGEVAPIIEEAPTVAQYLGRAWPFVRTALTGLLQFLSNEATQNSIDSLQAQLNALTAAFQAIEQADLYTKDREATAMVQAAHAFNNIGGSIGALGVNQQRMWYRLRYHIMPNTIQYIWTFVLHAWIWPLRKGLIALMQWDSSWFVWIQLFLVECRNYTRVVQIIGRNWRAKYVYPQLTFLLSPWRVAYYYQQQITTAVAQHIRGKDNAQTRDTISRVVYNDMSPLWQAFDGALAAWLQTDVDMPGWGASPPEFPKSAHDPPPAVPPGPYEPWQAEPTVPRSPDFVPNTIPHQDYIFGG